MDYLIDKYRKISKYVGLQDIMMILLTIAFVISINIFNKYKDYNFNEVFISIRLLIVFACLICIYLCFLYISQEDNIMFLTICFSIVYFCFEFMVRAVLLRLNVNNVSSVLELSNVKYPFVFGTILRPLTILLSIKFSRYKFMPTMKKSILILVVAFFLGGGTVLVDIYLLLPKFVYLSEQRIIVTIIDTVLVNVIALIVCMACNNKDKYSHKVLYYLILPIFAKSYSFFSSDNKSIYMIGSEVIILLILVMHIGNIGLLWSKRVRDAYSSIKQEDIGVVSKDELANIEVEEQENECSKDNDLRNMSDFLQSYFLIEENIKDILLIVDIEGRISYVSKSFFSLTGFNEEEIIGTSFFTITHPEDIIKAKILISLKKNDTVPIVHRIKQNNGKYIWTESIADLIFENDNITGKIIVARDISYKNL
ncbi:PAS domain S-box protein [Clostridium sp. C8-1-8]|uniref:PAS domain-containing protein n=1 Tax=Clostridium sp. C8-1-8 TaxID=2698831 RepID=UPI001367EE2A|nr:PAS domain S-box protein [Clostridium sp. C8-1-8]